MSLTSQLTPLPQSSQGEYESIHLLVTGAPHIAQSAAAEPEHLLSWWTPGKNRGHLPSMRL